MRPSTHFFPKPARTATLGPRWLCVVAVAACLVATPALAQDDSLDDIDALLEPAPSAPAQTAPAQGGGGGGGLDDLGGLGGLEGAEGGGGASAPAPASPSASSPANDGGLKLSFNGYVKPLVVWEYREYPEEFGGQEVDRFTTLGVRTQIRAQGVIKDRAQFFTAVNFDFNEVDQDTDTASTNSENGDLRMVEGYVDLFGDSTRWRMGSQIVTWSFMDGYEVPTDRLNARDLGYKSNELEDNKLASTGLEFSWSFADQKLDLFYIPVPKVNRLAPDFESQFSEEDNDELEVSNGVQGSEVESGDSQYAVAMSGRLPIFDYQLTYVDGRNPRPDLLDVPDPEEGDPVYFKRYERVQSPGIDLQFDLGSVLARASAVYWNTQDIGNDDPLKQNDWWQAMIGAEFWVDTALVQLNVGQRQVIDHDDDPDLEYQNILLGQKHGTVDIVAGSLTDQYLTGNALEFTFLFAYLFDDESGETVALRIRPMFSYNIADGVAVTFLPAWSNEIGIETTELYLETKFSF